MQDLGLRDSDVRFGKEVGFGFGTWVSGLQRLYIVSLFRGIRVPRISGSVFLSLREEVVPEQLGFSAFKGFGFLGFSFRDLSFIA